MNPLKFQVDVEKATPACSADCPNLNIEIEVMCYMADSLEELRRFRKFRCKNDEYCRRLYAAFDDERSDKE